VNQNTYAVRVDVDGSTITVAAGATSAPMYFVPSDTNNDNYQMTSVPNPTCGASNDGGYNLAAPHRYRMVITNVMACYIGTTVVGGPTPQGEAFTEIS